MTTFHLRFTCTLMWLFIYFIHYGCWNQLAPFALKRLVNLLYIFSMPVKCVAVTIQWLDDVKDCG